MLLKVQNNLYTYLFYPLNKNATKRDPQHPWCKQQKALKNLRARPSTIKLKINYLFVYLHRQQEDYIGEAGTKSLLCIQCYPETSQRPLLQNIPKSGLTMGSRNNYLRRNLEEERTCASSLLEMVSKVNENDICNLIHNTHLNKQQINNIESLNLSSNMRK